MNISAPFIRRPVATILLGIGLHKLPEGLALGAIVRASLTWRRSPTGPPARSAFTLRMRRPERPSSKRSTATRTGTQALQPAQLGR